MVTKIFNINSFLKKDVNSFKNLSSRWGCEETRAKEATSQCKDIQKTPNEKNLCYNFVILFQTKNI
jgi:hypothetical protein